MWRGVRSTARHYGAESWESEGAICYNKSTKYNHTLIYICFVAARYKLFVAPLCCAKMSSLCQFVANRHAVLKICFTTEEDEGLAEQWKEAGCITKWLCTISKRKCELGTLYENVLLFVLVFCMTMIVIPALMGDESTNGVACVCLKNGPNDPSLPSSEVRRSWFVPPSSEAGGRALLADNKTQHVEECAEKYPQNKEMANENARNIGVYRLRGSDTDRNTDIDICEESNPFLALILPSVMTQAYKLLFCYPCMESAFGVTTHEEEKEGGWKAVGAKCEPGWGIACCYGHCSVVVMVFFSIYYVFHVAAENPNMSPAAPAHDAIYALALNFGIYTPVSLTCIYYCLARKSGTITPLQCPLPPPAFVSIGLPAPPMASGPSLQYPAPPVPPPPPVPSSG